MEQLEFIIMSLTSYNNTVVQLIRSVLDLESRNDTDAELISAQSFSWAVTHSPGVWSQGTS